MIHVDQLELALHEIRKLERIYLGLTPRLSDLVVRRAQEVRVRDPGDLHRVLEREEDSRLRPLFGLHLQQILLPIQNRAARDLVRGVPRQHLGKSALAGAVRPHHRVHLAVAHRKIDAAEDFSIAGSGAKAADFE